MAAGVLAALVVLTSALPAGVEPLGRDSVGVVDARGEWRLIDPVTGGRLGFTYGNPADVPFTGDWDPHRRGWGGSDLAVTNE